MPERFDPVVVETRIGSEYVIPRSDNPSLDCYDVDQMLRDLTAACGEVRALREALDRAVSHLDDKDSYCGMCGDAFCEAVEDGKMALYALDHGCDVEDVTVCGYCGQPYLMPDLAQVLYHEQRPHRPMAAPEWSGESQRVADASAPEAEGCSDGR